MSAEPIELERAELSSIGFLKASPRTAIGMVPRMMYQPSRASGSCGARSRASAERSHAEAMLHRSRRK